MSAASLPVGAVRIGRWIVSSVPAGWHFEPGSGLRHAVAAEPRSNILVREDVLLAGDRLEPYIAAQVGILRGRFQDPVFAGPRPSTLVEADEALMLLIRHQPSAVGEILQVQTYARLGKWIGIVTLSTLGTMLPRTRPDYEQFVASLRIAPEEPAPGAATEVPR